MSAESPQSDGIRAANTAPIPFVEFVALVAALMSLGALGIDSMLPALPEIGHRLGVPDIGERTLIVTMFLVGFGVGQPLQGPLADRFGRKPVLGLGLAGYVVMTLLAGLASNFTLLLVARFIGGACVAATRVVTVAVVRDCFSGRAMAQVSSLAFMVFMAAPVIAPSIGQLILLAGSWRLIFEAIALAAALVLAWYWFRMPETLARANRRPLSVAEVLRGWRLTVTERSSLGYTLAATVMQGALLAYVTSIQPIMFDLFHRPDLLGLVFALAAAGMSVANLLSARIVMRVGMRRISQVALLLVIAGAVAGLVLGWTGNETLWVFVAVQVVVMMGYGVAASNMSAMAMENMGEIAATASSLQGFLVVTAGSVIATFVTGHFDGTTAPLHTAFLVGAVVALAIAAIVERGRLFHPS